MYIRCDFEDAAMDDVNNNKSRRNVIKGIGSGLGLGVLAVGTASAENKTEAESDDDQVGTEAMTGATTTFSPYTISSDQSSGEDSILSSSWSFFSPLPVGNTYQLDVLVEYDNVWWVDTVSSSVGSNDVTKEWEYRSDSPIGEAYHWQADVYLYDFGGASVSLEAEVEPIIDSSGEVEARTGTFYPWQDWSSATLTIE